MKKNLLNRVMAGLMTAVICPALIQSAGNSISRLKGHAAEQAGKK